jgi:hypothetical protein
MLEKRSKLVQAMGPAVTPNAGSGRGLVSDDVHSFVLRVSLDRPQGGGGRVRPQYQLEYVNGLSSRRFRSLDEVLGQIRSQVAEIFAGSGVAERW